MARVLLLLAAFIVTLTIHRHDAAAQESLFEALPDQFEFRHRKYFSSEHAEALRGAAESNDQEKLRHALVAGRDDLDARLRRVSSAVRRNSPEIAILRVELAILWLSTVYSAPSTEEKEAAWTQWEDHLQSAIEVLLNASLDKQAADYLVFAVLQAQRLWRADLYEWLASALDRHRAAFGDELRQWPLWTKLIELLDQARNEELIDEQEFKKTKEATLRNRLAAAKNLDSPRSRLRAQLDLITHLSEFSPDSRELLPMAREVFPTVKAVLKKSREAARIPEPIGMSHEAQYALFLSPGHGGDIDSLRQIFQNSGDVELERDAEYLLFYANALSPGLESDMIPLALTFNAILEGKYRFPDDYNNVLELLGRFRAGCDTESDLATACILKIASQAYRSLGAVAPALELEADRARVLEEADQAHLNEKLSAFVSLAELEWDYGTVAGAETALENARELVQQHPETLTDAIEAKIELIAAELADAELNDLRSRQHLAQAIKATKKLTEQPDVDGQGIEPRLMDIFIKHIRGQFCPTCGDEFGDWLNTYYGKWIKRPEHASVSLSNFVYGLVAVNLGYLDAHHIEDWRSAYFAESANSYANWREIVANARKASGYNGQERALFELLALMEQPVNSENMLDRNLELAQFLKETNFERKIALGRDLYTSSYEYSYGQFGGDASFIEDMLVYSIVLEELEYKVSSRAVLAILLDIVATSYYGKETFELEDARAQTRDMAPTFVAIFTRLARLALTAKDHAAAERYLNWASSTASEELEREWAAGSIRATLAFRNMGAALQQIADMRFKIAEIRASGDKSTLHAQAFLDLQLAMLTETALTILSATRRRATSSPELAETLNQRDITSQKIDNLDRILEINLLSRRGIEGEVERLRRQRSDLSTQISNEIKIVEDFSSIKSVELDELRGIIRKDEAVVLLHPTGNVVHAMLVDRHDATVSWTAQLSDNEIERRLINIRAGIDLNRLRGAFSAEPQARVNFPFSDVHQLYQKIFGPVHSRLKAVKRLVIIADGKLQALPFAVLTTSKPSHEPVNVNDFRNADINWLIEQNALAFLPSVRALVAQRKNVDLKGARFSFLGVGNPVLKGGGSNSRNADAATIFGRNGLADVGALSDLEPLPETEAELRTIAGTLNAKEGDLLLGARANETNVKAHRLGDYRIIAFATHGLLASNGIHGSGEPGLVLTPPDNPTDQDDGLLTLSEIMQLNLNADLVILSACDTASSDGRPRAGGLSGLARGFFAAGARSIMVTHWSIPSLPAVDITTTMVAARSANPSLDWASALQRAQVALIKNSGPAHFSHPANWGAFMIVGVLAER